MSNNLYHFKNGATMILYEDEDFLSLSEISRIPQLEIPVF
jgi:hypothetical protein